RRVDQHFPPGIPPDVWALGMVSATKKTSAVAGRRGASVIVLRGNNLAVAGAKLRDFREVYLHSIELRRSASVRQRPLCGRHADELRASFATCRWTTAIP